MLVEDFYQGHCHVKIYDDYCKDKTPEDVKEILRRIADIAYEPLCKALREKGEL